MIRRSVAYDWRGRRLFDVGRRHLIVADHLVLDWSLRYVSDRHPLVDAATITVRDPRGPWRAGGIAVRLWPTRTSRRTPALSVGWRGARAPAPRMRRREAEALRQLRADLRRHPFDVVGPDAARMGPAA